MDGPRPLLQHLVFSTSGILGSMGHSRESSCGGNSSRSISLASISSEGSTESPVVEQEEIAALTHYVRNFKESLGKLRRIFNPDRDRQETLRVATHERLGEVLRILRSVLEKYPALQSSELLASAGTLIQEVKGYNYEDERFDPKIFFESIDQLALAFSSRVSEYLMGDLEPSTSLSSSLSSKTKSCENLVSDVEGASDVSCLLSAQQIDTMLLTMEQGVDVALVRAKLWARYSKDIILYVEKRIHLDLEYAKNLGKLALSVGPAIKEENNLPFQSIYCTALEHDLNNSNANQGTCSLLLGNKFVETLSARRIEHERSRKAVKEVWHRELTAMHQAVSRIRKVRNTYVRCQHDWERARDALQAGNRDSQKKLAEDEAMQRMLAAESSYKECIVEANDRHLQLERVKTDVVQQIRELILQSDHVMKTVTVAYFQLQQTLASPWPTQFQSLCDRSRLYEPGSQYVEFVKRLPAAPTREHHPSSSGVSRSVPPEHKSSYYVDSEDIFAGKENVKTWRYGSDSDSIPSSPSSKSHDNSPTCSPKSTRRQFYAAISTDDLESTTDNLFASSSQEIVSRASESHSFRNLKTPSRCRECDSYVYFQGVDCIECGLTCHKKCLGTLAIICGHKRLPPRMTTFGLDLGQHLAETSATVPHIIVKCIAEIEERGITLKGIYRLSGVKSKVEKLCQAFENGADLVDLSDIHPNVIANVLKLYLRQLPEPLLTFKLYPDFIRVARECQTNCPTEVKAARDAIEDLLKRLPRHHYQTLAVLMQHLSAVSREADENNMPASNLGIVFGPTLLRIAEGSASLNCLVDTVHQTRAVELMISHVDYLFGVRTAKPNWATTAVAMDPEEKTTSEDASFLALPRSYASPEGNPPQIFKGSLKDYQGLEGVSLILLGSQLGGTSEDTCTTYKEEVNRQSTESWDYRLAWHPPQELEEVCQVFLEPPVLWNKKVSHRSSTTQEEACFARSTNENTSSDIDESPTKRVISTSISDKHDDSTYIPVVMTQSDSKEEPHLRNTSLDMQDFTSLLKNHFLKFQEDILVMPKSTTPVNQNIYHSSESEIETVIAVETCETETQSTSSTLTVAEANSGSSVEL